jgi:DNA repair protein RadC
MKRLSGLGMQSLSDNELLSIFIRSGTKGSSALDISDKILKYRAGNLRNLVDLSFDEFLEFPGIGEIKAIQLKAIAEITERLSRNRRNSKIILSDPRSIAEYFMETMRSLDRENLIAVFFDMKSGLIGYRTIAIGTRNVAPVCPDVIFREAVSAKAAYLVLLHNHPSGDPTPSNEDRNVTKRIKECGNLMNIPLSDHIIIGDNNFYSFFREKEL